MKKILIDMDINVFIVPMVIRSFPMNFELYAVFFNHILARVSYNFSTSLNTISVFMEPESFNKDFLFISKLNYILLSLVLLSTLAHHLVQ
jgi:hypothetical protein